MARDGGSPSLNGTMVLGISVLDVNDNDPTFLNLPGNVSLSEDSGVRSVVLQVIAIDADAGANALLSFSISAGNVGGAFSIHTKTGLVTVNNVLDRERQAEYVLNIMARDNPENPSYARKDSNVLLIHVLDENDNQPVFSKSTYEAEIQENSPSGTYVTVTNGPVIATDMDAGNNGTVTYELFGNGSQYFSIDASKGTVVVATAEGLDREAIAGAHLDFFVLAQDGGGLNSTAQFLVSLLDVNDNPPVFKNASLSIRIMENSPPGSFVGQLTAEDADVSPSAQVWYHVETGAGDTFVVDATDGTIRISSGAQLDREIRDLYTLTVLAIDRGTPALSASATVKIFVDDVNDARPEFLSPIQSITIDESLEVGSVVAMVTARDLDIAPKLEYYIIEVAAFDDDNAPVTNQANVFGIDFHTGAVFLNSRLDREKVASFVLTISTRDRASDLVNVSVSDPNAVLTVLVMDVNDNAPWFRPTGVRNFSDQVIEGAPPGTTLLSVAAVDPDKGLNGVVSYSLLGLPPGGYIRIDDPAAGKVSINRTIDYEEVQWLNFSIQASDHGRPPRSTTVPVFIHILDINDNNPMFNPLSYTRYVSEDVEPGTVLLQTKATDADSGNFAVVEYSLVDGEGKFGITPLMGEIYVLSPLDREKKDRYTLTVTARDNPGAPTSNRRGNSAQAYITVLDVNDVRPRFSKSRYSTSVYENEPQGTSVVSLIALDTDEGENGKVSYSLQGPGASAFVVDPETGVVITLRLLRSYEQFNLTVVATDAGQPPLWGSADLQVEVVDVNDNRPVFVRPVNGTTVNITEEREPHLMVYEVFATDMDEGVNGAIRYGFLHTEGVGSHDWESFSIDPESGVISTARRLDREKQPVFNLILLASDQGQPVAYESTQMLTIVLKDIDDNEPAFPPTPAGWPGYQALYVLEHSNPGTVVGRVGGAVDADEGTNAMVFYYIAAGNEDGSLHMDHLGRMTILHDLDREKQPFISVLVKASSNPAWQPRFQVGPWETVSDASLQELRIFLEDINDQWPRFVKDEYTAGVATDAKVGSDLLQVEAVDADAGNNSLVSYTLLNIFYIKHHSNTTQLLEGIFTLGEHNGILRTYDLFTAYSPGYFLLTVLASDPAGHNATATVGVYILRQDQRVRIVVNETPERVRDFQDELTRLLSNITGAIVNTDDVQFHVDSNGRVNFAQTDMLIHVVNRDTNRIMDVSRVIAMIDKNKEQLKSLFRTYNVLDVQPAALSPADDNISSLQMAIIILAVLMVLLLVLFAVIMWYSRTIHKRKLRAIMAGSLGNQGFMEILDNVPNTNKYAVEGANPVWLDPYFRDMELTLQAEHDDDLPENLSSMTDRWESPVPVTHGTFGREPATAKRRGDHYLHTALQEYDNIARLGNIIREGPMKLIPAGSDEALEDGSPLPGSLRLRHRPPTELTPGPEGVRVMHGSTGIFVPSDVSSLPEDDQRPVVSGRERGTNTATESAQCSPARRLDENTSYGSISTSTGSARVSPAPTANSESLSPVPGPSTTVLRAVRDGPDYGHMNKCHHAARPAALSHTIKKGQEILEVTEL
uniref:Cadherin-related 23 n=1 Tax=Eptatretus burgeri TaxID=7764 RepID=A0A8C4R7S3_EPTBU